MKTLPVERRPRRITCVICKTVTLCTYEPDPYAEDVHNDGTPVWECAACRRAQAMEI